MLLPRGGRGEARVSGGASQATRSYLFVPIKGMEEKSVAHATAKRLRESQCLAFYGGEDARATPPRRAPREESPAFVRSG